MDDQGRFLKMLGNVTVERAAVEDWEEAMEVVWQTFLKFEADVYSEEGTANFLDFISSDFLYKMFLLGDYHAWVAKDEEDIVGFGSLRSGNHISLLFVREEYQKRGIGKELIRAMQKDCIQRGVVTLTVNASPYGVPFYHKLGFMDLDEVKETDGIIYTPMELLNEI